MFCHLFTSIFVNFKTLKPIKKAHFQRGLPMSPPLNDWIILSIFQFSGEMFQFFNQGADIKLISSLVNKKAAFD